MRFEGIETEVISRRLEQLCGRERNLLVDFLLHLGEFDRRRGYEALGYATLWAYCVQHLHYGEGETFRRTNAARLLRSYPQAAERLRDGRLSMSTLVALQHVLTEANADRLFETSKFKSKRDVEILVAKFRAPVPEPAAMIRKLPQRNVEAGSVGDRTEAAQPLLVLQEPPIVQAIVSSVTLPAATPRPEVTPHAEDRFIVRFAVSSAFVEKLEKAKSILSHVFPNRDTAAVLERALDEIVEREMKKHGPRKKGTAKAETAGRGSHAVPAAVKREVWERDNSRCSWRMPSGEVCGSDHQVQEDHVVPRALGGSNDAPNIRLLCRAHNLMHARQTLGPAFIDSQIERARNRRADA